MKLAAAWLFLLALVGGLAASTSSCSLEHRSDAYACAQSSDCTADRRCDNGFCVLVDNPGPVDARIDGPGGRPDSAMVDARPMDIDAPSNVCPVQCTSCDFGAPDRKVCIVDCAEANDGRCSTQIACPPGYVCDVRCNTQNACRSGLNCTQATECIVECSGQSSCRNVLCGEGPCDVECTGLGSCRAIGCNNSCACDVGCFAGSACDNVQCPSFQCDDFDGGCTSLREGCDTCQ